MTDLAMTDLAMTDLAGREAVLPAKPPRAGKETGVGPSDMPLEIRGAACRETGQFISAGGCFALRGEDGVDVFLDICPVPLHMIDQRVEIAGRRFGSRHILVEAIGPVGALS